MLAEPQDTCHVRGATSCRGASNTKALNTKASRRCATMEQWVGARATCPHGAHASGSADSSVPIGPLGSPRQRPPEPWRPDRLTARGHAWHPARLRLCFHGAALPPRAQYRHSQKVSQLA